MSLLDTINGAKKEVLQNAIPAEEKGTAGKAAAGKGLAAKTADIDEQGTGSGSSNTGFSKKSASRAKPARAAAEGVRVVQVTGGKTTSTKPQSQMTKEEKKEARRAERDLEDKRMAASRALLNKQPGYKKAQRVWWIALVIGLVMTLLSYSLGQLYPQATAEPTSAMGILVLALMIMAYVVIIGAFVYDWRVVRPMRKKVERDSASLTNKRMEQILKEDAQELVKEEAKRAEAKAARKAKKNMRHEQKR